MVVKELFGKVKIYRLHTRVDNRGSLAYVFDESIDDFKARETRIYSMPKEGTFFGIHYRDERAPNDEVCDSHKRQRAGLRY